MDRDQELLALIKEQYEDMKKGSKVYPQRNTISLDKVAQHMKHGGEMTLLDFLTEDGEFYEI